MYIASAARRERAAVVGSEERDRHVTETRQKGSRIHAEAAGVKLKLDIGVPGEVVVVCAMERPRGVVKYRPKSYLNEAMIIS